MPFRLRYQSLLKFETLGPILTCVCVVWLYASSLHGGFLWDDTSIYIVDNELLRFPEGLWRFWFSNEPADYYPLCYSTFWVEYQFTGLNPWLYRVDNLAIHLSTSLFVWCVLRQLKIPAAGWAAALFAVHPVCVESVAWVSQRKAVLGTSLGFACIAGYLQYEATGKRRWFVVAVFLFAMSLASKPVLITLPAVLFLYGWWWKQSTLVSAAIRVSPFAIVSFVFGVVGILYQQKLIGLDDVRNQTLLERTLTSGWVVWFYIGKVLLPMNLSFVYSRWTIDARNPLHWMPLLLLIIGLILAYKFRNHSAVRVVLTAAGFFLLTLFPAMGFVDVYYWRYSYVGDHYQYQSMISLIVLVTVGWHQIATRWFSVPPWRFEITLTGLLIAASVVANYHARKFVSEEILWRDTLSKNPDSDLAFQNLALLSLAAPETDTMIDSALASAKLRPTATFVLALKCHFAGRNDRAKEQFEECLQLGFEPYTVHMALARLENAEGDSEAAIAELKRATQLKPHKAEAWFRLGELLAAKGRRDEAECAFRQIPEKCFSMHCEGWFEIAKLRLQAGEIEAAITAAESAVRLRPNRMPVRALLERTLRRAGRIGDADKELKAMLSGL